MIICIVGCKRSNSRCKPVDQKCDSTNTTVNLSGGNTDKELKVKSTCVCCYNFLVIHFLKFFSTLCIIYSKII